MTVTRVSRVTSEGLKLLVHGHDVPKTSADSVPDTE